MTHTTSRGVEYELLQRLLVGSIRVILLAFGSPCSFYDSMSLFTYIGKIRFDESAQRDGVKPFIGEDVRLDGKKRKDMLKQKTATAKSTYVWEIPDDYQIGTLRFLQNMKPAYNKDTKNSDEFKAFTGEKFILLRKSRK